MYVFGHRVVTEAGTTQLVVYSVTTKKNADQRQD